ncbi:hypothetical protein Godav_004816 [Gossypium davidsonii]|uniref:Uncharacterized protein n=1 Tax=Gossypium davidsonii TaxID=34287 RepID=A0A7J8SMF0_GOSDV|nr:hypothetical protein [Gossypium davidsonii]
MHRTRVSRMINKKIYCCCQMPINWSKLVFRITVNCKTRGFKL